MSSSRPVLARVTLHAAPSEKTTMVNYSKSFPGVSAPNNSQKGAFFPFNCKIQKNYFQLYLLNQILKNHQQKYINKIFQEIQMFILHFYIIIKIVIIICFNICIWFNIYLIFYIFIFLYFYIFIFLVNTILKYGLLTLHLII